MPRDTLRGVLEHFDTSNTGSLDFVEFVRFIKSLRVRDELQKVYHDKFSDKKYIQDEQFYKFVREDQNEINATPQYVTALIAKSEAEPTKERLKRSRLGTGATKMEQPAGISHSMSTKAVPSKTKQIAESTSAVFQRPTTNSWQSQQDFVPPDCLSMKGFINYLVSKHNGPCDNQVKKVTEDMLSHPLSHYLIASSHNTYLEGDQLKSKASVEAYKKVLLEGCRCIELDCWDSRKGPIITHGGTLTSSVRLNDVLICIRDHGFVASQYPIILSIENHLTTTNQIEFVKQLDAILGAAGMLPDSKVTSLFNAVLAGGASSGDLPSPQDLLGKVLIKNPQKKKKGSEKVEDILNPWTHTPKELLERIHFKTRPWPGFKAKNNGWELASLNEDAAKKLVNKPKKLINWTQNSFVRIYPKGARVDSSNFMPTSFWMTGCQLVSLNYQTNDLAMQINRALFSLNGGCGYILKPEYMLKPKQILNPSDAKLAPKLAFTLTLISGWQLPPPKRGKNEVVVRFSVYGATADTRRNRKRSTIIKANRWNPVW
eukprot:CAMPEP_0168512318 /NCGR_PEP_ID=MMETSP0405-20121227/2701_1 /TAXON_ID=498012 /ORGANISM="Trichosphaerium sp, Strain Am-I-7 wt" /LENGTH=542 /DNA_ID=CAMNT_0008530747 /DNA_START=528 /DNA_END=2153 /DNA_ORIENTATION=-